MDRLMLRDQWNTGHRRPETLELEEAAGAEEQKTLHKDTDDPNITSDFLAMCVKNADVGKEVTKEAAGAKKGGRTYVKIVKDGEEEDITEVATNSDGF